MAGPHSRRSVLKLSGTTVASALIAGCSALGDNESGLVLGDILVRNAHPDTHTARIELKRDGEFVAEETLEVPGDGGVTAMETTWSSDPAVYTLQYVIVGPDEEPNIRERTLTATDGADQACTIAAITMGFPEDVPPHVSMGPPKSMGGSCPE